MPGSRNFALRSFTAWTTFKRLNRVR